VAETRLQAYRRRVLNEWVHRAWAKMNSAGAIAPGTNLADRFGSFGVGSLIGFPPSSIYGERYIHIGADTLVGIGSTITAGYSPSDHRVPERALVIGDRCVIGLRASVVAHESIVIGDDVWTGQDVYITDSNHGFDDLETPIGRQLGTHQPVSIGSGSWIGHGVVVLPGTTIGRNVVVAAGSVVRGDVPDHSVVAGVPARMIRSLVEVPDNVEASAV
jgi:acetyltransferase-like isoleucine patch superfamily enzyme